VSQYYEHIEEMEWAIEECLHVASMCIGPEGDMHNVSAAECTIRMAKAGAHVVCIHRHFVPLIG
jgi:betaine-homocysteine S-methyltransferase